MQNIFRVCNQPPQSAPGWSKHPMGAAQKGLCGHSFPRWQTGRQPWAGTRVRVPMRQAWSAGLKNTFWGVAAWLSRDPS